MNIATPPTKKTKSAVTGRAAERRKHQYQLNVGVGERHVKTRMARRARRRDKKLASGDWKPYGKLAKKMHKPNPNHVEKVGKRFSNVALLPDGSLRCGGVIWQRLHGTVNPPFTGTTVV